MVRSRVHELQEASAIIAVEISSRNARVAALQKRWDLLRAGLDLILDQRGADVADLPGGASGMLVRGYKGNKPIGWWSASTPAWFRWSLNRAATSGRPTRNWASGRRWSRVNARRLAGGDYPGEALYYGGA